MSLEIFPLTLKQANELVQQLHRHHKPCQGHRFSLGLININDSRLVGAVIVGRPVCNNVEQYYIAEVTRLVTDGTKNACSMLYGAAARVCNEMGFRKIQTYILESESGVSLRASGWVKVADTKGASWNTKKRVRRTDQPICNKQRWEKILNY